MAGKPAELLFAIETAETQDQLGRFPGWKLHPLKGDLKGFWSLTVTGNWTLRRRVLKVEGCHFQHVGAQLGPGLGFSEDRRASARAT
jgi:hypothetical protein